ncbi:MAG: putative ABC transporter permease [Clostridia bacterium]|nr:putative ABC transporter permease [Clostridia bacterium]
MEGFLIACFLFIVGSVLGWCLEVLFRRFFTAKKWINPGFLTGPYLPLYGFGLAGLYGITLIPIETGSSWGNALAYIAVMTAAMILIEYIAGLIFIKGLKIKLWDYSKRRGNIQGIICPLFSFFWLIVAVIYYFVIDPYVIDAVAWFTNNLIFGFFVGIIFGVFLVDLGHSINLTAHLRKFATENRIIISYEKLKESIHDKFASAKADAKNKLMEKTGNKGKVRPSFLFAFKSRNGLEDALKTYKEEQDTALISGSAAAAAASDAPAEEGQEDSPDVHTE